MNTVPTPRRSLAVNAGAWISMNVLCGGSYLYFASKTWIEPELRGEDVARGEDAFVWFGTAFPFALVCFVADLIMVALAVKLKRRKGYWSPLLVALGIGLGWAGILTIDVVNR